MRSCSLGKRWLYDGSGTFLSPRWRDHTKMMGPKSQLTPAQFFIQDFPSELQIIFVIIVCSNMIVIR